MQSPLQIRKPFSMRTNGNPVKGRKQELAEHHFGDSSAVSPKQEMGGRAAIRTENTPRRFVIPTETREYGSPFTLSSAEMPKLPTIHPLTLSALVFNLITVHHFQPPPNSCACIC